MRKQILILILSLLLILSYTIPVLASIVKNDFGTWNSAYIKVPMTEKVDINLETKGIFQYDLADIFVLRPSIGYNISDDLSIWQGYAYFDPNAFSGFLENRSWQQVQYGKKFSWLDAFGRFRLEERFLTETDNNDDFSLRGRFLLRLMFPFTKKKNWFFVLQDELLTNFNDAESGYADRGYDQNRFFTGVNYKVNDNVSLELGYQLQDIDIDFGKLDAFHFLTHSVLFNLFIQTPQVFNKAKAKQKHYWPVY